MDGLATSWIGRAVPNDQHTYTHPKLALNWTRNPKMATIHGKIILQTACLGFPWWNFRCIDLKSNDLPSLVLLKLRQGEADEVHWVDCILDCKQFTLMGWFDMGMSPNLGKLRSVAALFDIHLSTEIWRRMILTILTSLNLLNIQQLACLRPSKRCQLCVCVWKWGRTPRV